MSLRALLTGVDQVVKEKERGNRLLDRDPDWRKVLAYALHRGLKPMETWRLLRDHHGYPGSRPSVDDYVREMGREVLLAEGRAIAEELEAEANAGQGGRRGGGRKASRGRSRSKTSGAS